MSEAGIPTPASPLDASSKRKTGRKSSALGFLLFLTFVGVTCFYLYHETTPNPRQQLGTMVEIPEGASLSTVAKILQAKNIIRSPMLFSLLVTFSGKEKQLLPGMYLFNEPENIFAIATRFENSQRGIETLRITLPEGLSRKEMSDILSKNLHAFNSAEFLARSEGQEGYLFPDTYFFLSTATSGEVYRALTDNYAKKTAALMNEATLQHKNWSDIMIMASLVEGEAVTKEARRIVSGILWNRIANGMRLGVDAPFAYIMGKGSLELTQSDLATSSPYNTYRNAGLPPTPINNPGLDAIDAALHPAATPYLYYLSDKAGNMYYAKTFQEHKLNKEKYLR